MSNRAAKAGSLRESSESVVENNPVQASRSDGRSTVVNGSALYPPKVFAVTSDGITAKENGTLSSALVVDAVRRGDSSSTLVSAIDRPSENSTSEPAFTAEQTLPTARQ